MATMQITTRRVGPSDGPILARIRLAALRDAPSAFSKTYEEESANTEMHWADVAAERSTGRDHATYFALDGGLIVGLVGGHRSDGGGEVELVSMWADPAQRGRGIGAALVDVIVGWADGDSVGLWVMRGNEDALRLYERCGFSETDDYQALPSDPCKDEIRMRRDPA